MQNNTFQDHLNWNVCGHYRLMYIYCHIACISLYPIQDPHLQVSRQLNHVPSPRLPNYVKIQAFKTTCKTFVTHLRPVHSKKLKSLHFRTIQITLISIHSRTVLTQQPEIQLFKIRSKCPFKILLSVLQLCGCYTCILFHVTPSTTLTSYVAHHSHVNGCSFSVVSHTYFYFDFWLIGP